LSSSLNFQSIGIIVLKLFIFVIFCKKVMYLVYPLIKNEKICQKLNFAYPLIKNEKICQKLNFAYPLIKNEKICQKLNFA